MPPAETPESKPTIQSNPSPNAAPLSTVNQSDPQQTSTYQSFSSADSGGPPFATFTAMAALVIYSLISIVTLGALIWGYNGLEQFLGAIIFFPSLVLTVLAFFAARGYRQGNQTSRIILIILYGILAVVFIYILPILIISILALVNLFSKKTRAFFS